ncbi:M61 family metallopeptidase [Mangrovibacterium lignilyticum]|uniref:M61 family metallopeptidase n=1 Tax=Mangrovibacterium lignilyticum TaxID=2668052 RepID=UPI0013D17D39|nr:M61 family metallopeptidase [Mangrovibacterium lignilyticum]
MPVFIKLHLQIAAVFRTVFLLVVISVLDSASAFAGGSAIQFTVRMEHPENHQFQVEMIYGKPNASELIFTMPAWTPGYYQMLDFAKQVDGLTATNEHGETLPCEKVNKNSWRVENQDAAKVILNYDVICEREFVATPWLDEERAYIIPGALFLYPKDEIKSPVQIKIEPGNGWKDVATGLEKVGDSGFVFSADNYDVLYDSPLLIGDLKSLPSFDVKGIPHYFVGYKMGKFEEQAFMDDLKKVIEAAAEIIGDIPYEQYTFIGIGPGRGGIEHLNSTSVSFTGDGLNSRQERLRILSFLAHEYFHHYNVKRIRPIELGPFDYEKENRTNLLWVSEGLTVYYEYLVMTRAGLFTEDDLLQALQNDLLAVERSPGRLFQTLAESSYETWSDGPFGRIDDEVNKTISYYQKGPVVGWLFDFKIREATGNTKSMDDVMRRLYTDFYKGRKRGFTEDELRVVLEETAGEPMDSLFDYIYTTKALDYNKYLSGGGYQVDTTVQTLSGAWFGASVNIENDSVFIGSVEWQSPAWDAGLRKNHCLVSSEGFSPKKLRPVLQNVGAGDTVWLEVQSDGGLKKIPVILKQKKERSFKISSIDELTTSEQALREKWLSGNK